MPGPIVHLGATVMCAHGGSAHAASPFPRVTVSVASPSSPCPRRTSWRAARSPERPTPPCVTGQWVVGAVRVLAGGVPVAVQSGTSITTPTGTPMLPLVVQPG